MPDSKDLQISFDLAYIQHFAAASLISPWLLWQPPAESHYNIYDRSVVGYVSHVYCIVLLYSVGYKVITATANATATATATATTTLMSNWSKSQGFCYLVYDIIRGHWVK